MDAEHQTQYDIIPETCADALALWDAGGSVFTIEMGGMGPGYEQAIQILVFELIREGLKSGTPERDDSEAWKTWGDDVIKRCDEKYGYSGAQVGAAKSLASGFLVNGYRTTCRSPELDPDRRIQVSKNFPKG